MTDDYAPRSWHGRQIRRQKMLALLAELAETGEPIPRGWDLVAMTGFTHWMPLPEPPPLIG